MGQETFQKKLILHPTLFALYLWHYVQFFRSIFHKKVDMLETIQLWTVYILPLHMPTQSQHLIIFSNPIISEELTLTFKNKFVIFYRFSQRQLDISYYSVNFTYNQTYHSMRKVSVLENCSTLVNLKWKFVFSHLPFSLFDKSANWKISFVASNFKYSLTFAPKHFFEPSLL